MSENKKVDKAMKEIVDAKINQDKMIPIETAMTLHDNIQSLRLECNEIKMNDWRFRTEINEVFGKYKIDRDLPF